MSEANRDRSYARSYDRSYDRGHMTGATLVNRQSEVETG